MELGGVLEEVAVFFGEVGVEGEVLGVEPGEGAAPFDQEVFLLVICHLPLVGEPGDEEGVTSHVGCVNPQPGHLEDVESAYSDVFLFVKVEVSVGEVNLLLCLRLSQAGTEVPPSSALGEVGCCDWC